MTITLFTRAGCHLCEQAQHLLMQAGRGQPARITAVDIDTDSALRDRYGNRVPVARIGNTELDWPFTREQAVRAMTAAAG